MENIEDCKCSEIFEKPDTIYDKNHKICGGCNQSSNQIMMENNFHMMFYHRKSLARSNVIPEPKFYIPKLI